MGYGNGKRRRGHTVHIRIVFSPPLACVSGKDYPVTVNEVPGLE